MKKIGDGMKHVLPRMPNDIMKVPLYFETVENAFRSFEVDRRNWVKLLLPLMTQRARNVINIKQGNIGGQRQLCYSQRKPTKRIQINPKSSGGSRGGPRGPGPPYK